jgi:hypothetical protein
VLASVVALAGCLPESFQRQEKLDRVQADPFGIESPAPSAPVRQVSYAPAPPDLAQRVDFIGRRIVAANPQLAMKPLFGSPTPEIFHQGTNMLWITSGLVEQCKTEAQLAAVISQELGKMVSEREAKASPTSRNPEGLPPPDVPVGQAASMSGQDMTHLAELGKYERAHPRLRRRLPPPDPQFLARMYLEKAGYQPTDLETVQPILQAAERNFVLEKQMKGGPTQPSWGQ